MKYPLVAQRCNEHGGWDTENTEDTAERPREYGVAAEDIARRLAATKEEKSSHG